mgnify:CR=1 FL=1
MKQVRFLFILFFALSTQQVWAQDAAIKTDTIVVKGNCSMCKERIEEGQVEDVFPYPQEIRFIHQSGHAPVPQAA